MKKLIMIISFLLATLIMLSACGTIAIDDSNLKLSKPEYAVSSSASEKYTMTVDENSLAIIISDKVTGREIWNSNNVLPNSETHDNGLRPKWEAVARSAVTVVYSRESEISLLGASKKTIKITNTANGFKADIEIKDISLKFQLKVSLVDDYLDIEIPYSSIEEDASEKNRLMGLYLYPFFDSTRGVQTTEQESYIFVPDGSGALIDTKTKTLVSNPSNIYSARVYGNDYGVSGLDAIKRISNGYMPYSVTLPAFGMVSGGKGYITHITGGAEYSEIKATTYGMLFDYNFAYNTFHYRDSYTQLTNNSGGTQTDVQTDKNVFDAKMRIMLLEGEDANYSGMARRLRSDLLSSGLLAQKSSTKTDIPLKTDFLMSESRKEVVGSSVVRMSTADFVQSAFKELKSNVAGEIYSTLYGYTNGGLSGSSPKHFGLESKTGSNREYKDLAKFAEQNDVKLAFGADYVQVRKDSGSFAKKDIAMTLSKQIISLPNYNSHEYNTDDLYILHAKASKKYFENEKKDFKNIGISSVQLSTLGNLLTTSSFNYTQNRTEALTQYKNLVESSGFDIVLDNPNMYFWDNVAAISNSPISNSGYMIALESIPFVQMLTSGSITSFRNAININCHDRDDILNMIDYGVYPSYQLTEEDPINLYRTDSFYLFSSQYSVWQEHINATYLEVNSALRQVIGANFTERKALSRDIYECSYSNGVKFIINYTAKDFACGEQTIPAKNFVTVNQA